MFASIIFVKYLCGYFSNNTDALSVFSVKSHFNAVCSLPVYRGSTLRLFCCSVLKKYVSLFFCISRLLVWSLWWWTIRRTHNPLNSFVVKMNRRIVEFRTGRICRKCILGSTEMIPLPSFFKSPCPKPCLKIVISESHFWNSSVIGNDEILIIFKAYVVLVAGTGQFANSNGLFLNLPGYMFVFLCKETYWRF